MPGRIEGGGAAGARVISSGVVWSRSVSDSRFVERVNDVGCENRLVCALFGGQICLSAYGSVVFFCRFFLFTGFLDLLVVHSGGHQVFESIASHFFFLTFLL